MSLRFLPNRDLMVKEIEQWIVHRKLDTLLAVCDCCAYKMFDFILTIECRECTVRKGILRVRNEKKKEDVAVADVC